MFEFERRWAKSVLEAFAPEGVDGLSPRAREVRYVASLEKMLSASPAKVQLGLRAGVALCALSPLWRAQHRKTFASLPVEVRASLLDELLSHPNALIRELALFMKLQASLALLGTSSVRARSRYDGHSEDLERSGERRVRLPILDDRERVAS